MSSFYRGREQQRLSKAEALRRAQLELLGGTTQSVHRSSRGERGAVSLATTKPAASRLSPDAPYAHPYYWAPFVLMGNWK
jgi:CHAT domain-containing protein